MNPRYHLTYLVAGLLTLALGCSGESSNEPDSGVDVDMQVTDAPDLDSNDTEDMQVSQDSGGTDMPDSDADMDMSAQCGSPGDILRERDLASIQGCTTYAGTIDLADFTGSDLESLSSLEEIGGNLNLFRANSLTNLSGLGNLRRVGGDLIVFFSRSMESLNGLESLEVVTGKLRLENNESLTSLKGLDSLKESGGLDLTFNSALTDIRALAAFETVRGDLEIRGNTSLPQPAVDSFVGRITVEGETRVGF